MGHSVIPYWKDTGAWVGGVVPGAGDTAVFPSSAQVLLHRILTVMPASPASRSTDSQAAYSISDGGTYTLTVGSGGISVTINGTAAATTAVSVNLSLSAAESLTTTDNTGATTLSLSGAVAAGNVVTIAGNGDVDISGAVSGSGGLTMAGSGTLIVSEQLRVGRRNFQLRNEIRRVE